MVDHFARSLTKQIARKVPSRPGCSKIGAHFVALLGIVVLATTFVARLVIIPILAATHSAEDFFSGSLVVPMKEEFFTQ
jgi:hypothetical protein